MAAGIDIGDTVATKNNLRGDRELLFLGRAANMAAKIIDEGILVTEEAADAIPADLAGYLIETPSGYELDLPDDELDALIEDQGWAWSLEGSRTRVEEAMEACPSDRVKVSAAQGEIDKTELGLANSKQVTGVSFFADVDGFTAYVDEAAATDEDLVEAIQAYHVIRSEMRYVAVEDFEGYGALRIQYAGDRMQHGQPDVVCIGPATEAAVRYQQALDGWETGISKELRDQLPEELAARVSGALRRAATWPPT
jgi:hypothetical protein